MDDNLSQQLEKLRLKRQRKLRQLEGIEDQITHLLMGGQTVTARDKTGNLLQVGDLVRTILKQGYNERKAKVIILKDDTVTIEFIKAKVQTWRKSHNLI